MSKLVLTSSIVLGLTIAGTPLAATDAKAPIGSDVGQGQQIQDFCKELADSGEVPWLSVGECIALNLSSDAEGQNFWAHRCDNWRDEGLLELIGFSSYSECIHDH